MSGLLSLNSNCVKIDALTATDENDAVSFVNDAVATVTLTIGGTDVTGETWPLSIPYVAASDGDYFVALAANIGIVKDDIVRVEVIAVSPTTGTAKWDEEIRVTNRALDSVNI